MLLVRRRPWQSWCSRTGDDWLWLPLKSLCDVWMVLSVSVAVGKYNLQNINTFILLLLHLSLPPLPHINTIYVFLAGDRVTDDDWLSSSPSGGLQRWRWRDGSSSVYVRPSRVHIHNVGSGQTTGTRQGLWRSLVTGCQWVCHRHRFPCSYLPIVLNRGSSHDSGKYLLSNAFPGNPRAASAVDVVVVSTAAAEEYYVSLSLARWWLCFNLSRDCHARTTHTQFYVVRQLARVWSLAKAGSGRESSVAGWRAFSESKQTGTL